MTSRRSSTILVTGAAGYIGTVTCDTLLTAGYAVCGLDNLSHGVHGLKHLLSQPSFIFRRADITDRNAVRDVLREISPAGVVHLAAIVGDPASKLQPDWTVRVNRDATTGLYRAAADAGSTRFVFASTCSNYGLSDSDQLLSEDSALKPLSPYAVSKVEAEEWLLRHSSRECPTTILRFATAHGLSPRMRFDLTINEFAKTICERRPLCLYDGDTWRPYCHVCDIARAIEIALTANRSLAGDCVVFNVGSSQENYTKRQVIDCIEAVAGFRAEVTDLGAGRDPRNYRVSFEKIGRHYDFAPRFDVSDTARQIVRGLDLNLFPEEARIIYGNV